MDVIWDESVEPDGTVLFDGVPSGSPSNLITIGNSLLERAEQCPPQTDRSAASLMLESRAVIQAIFNIMPFKNATRPGTQVFSLPRCHRHALLPVERRDHFNR